MHKELQQPIAERIALGHRKEAIKKEVMGFGYSAQDFEEAYAAATNITPATPGKTQGKVTQSESVTRARTTTTAKQDSATPFKFKKLLIGGVALVVVVLIIAGAWAMRAHLLQAPIADPFADGVYETWQRTIDDPTIINMVRPSVVRVLTHFVGTTTLQRFDIDFETFDLTLEGDAAEPIVQTFDTYGWGTGFFISEHGRILTNAHVVFPSSIRESIFDEWYSAELYEEIQQNPQFDSEVFLEQIEELARNDDGVLEKNSKRFMVDHSGLEYEAEVVILDPNGEGDTFNELLDESIPARVVALEEDYEFENKDAAVIEISATDLPALRISDVDEVTVGDPVYVFGYPGNTDVSNLDATESSFTTGAVNAIKNAPFGDFKLIQTDAKISGGSSGGPMVNSQGEVIGLITLATGGFFGDNFGFAIPVSVLDQLEGYVDNDETQGHQHQSIMKGLFLMEQKHCVLAIEHFNRGLAENETFNNKEFLEEKIATCTEMIESGESIDTRYEQFMSTYKTTEMLTLVALGGTLIALFLIVLGLVVLVIRNRRSIEANRDSIDKHHSV